MDNFILLLLEFIALCGVFCLAGLIVLVYSKYQEYKASKSRFFNYK